MQLKMAIVVAGLMWVSQAAAAGTIEQALEKLAPEERSQQICVLRGLSAVHRDPRLRHADRLQPSIFSNAVLDGTVLDAKGGAVRVDHRWYELSFNCQLTDDMKKAKSFSFKMGSEIPKEKWDELGLWP